MLLRLSFRLFVLFSFAMSLNFFVIPPQHAHAELNCNAFKSYNKKRRCLRELLKIQKEKSRSIQRNIDGIDDAADTVDCVLIAGNAAARKAYKAKGVAERIGLIIAKKVAREASRKTYKSKSSCLRWAMKQYNKYTKRCMKWMDRNNVVILRGGRPWTRNRGYLKVPSYCR